MALDKTQGGRGEPASRWTDIVPDDDSDLEFLPRAIYIGGDGDIKVRDASGNDEVFVGLTAGTILPIRPHRVLATGTSATSLIALY